MLSSLFKQQHLLTIIHFSKTNENKPTKSNKIKITNKILIGSFYQSFFYFFFGTNLIPKLLYIFYENFFFQVKTQQNKFLNFHNHFYAIKN